MLHRPTGIQVERRGLPIFDTEEVRAAEAAHGWKDREFMYTLAQKFVYSKYNLALWVLLIGANGLALHWTMYRHLGWTTYHPEPHWFIVLEVLLNVFMVVDIFARMCTLGILFWRHWYNIADVMVMVLCVIATGYFVHFHDQRIEGDGAETALIADEVLIAVRTFMSLIRSLLFLKTKKSIDSAMHSPIEFSPHISLEEAEWDEESHKRGLHGGLMEDIEFGFNENSKEF